MTDALHALARRYPLDALPVITERYERRAAALNDPAAQCRLRRSYDRFVFYSKWAADLLAIVDDGADRRGAA